MKKIISFGLWGKNKCYNYGAIENVILAKKLYSDWICYIFYNNTCITKVIEQLKTYDNVRLIKINNNDLLSFNMFWRFSPAFEKDNIVIIRDTDSRLNIKEKTAVDEFLKSDKDFHIMRDHKLHTQCIMGGMWGCKNNILVPYKKQFYDYLKIGKKYSGINQDQYWLRVIIYPNIVNNSIIHDDIYKREKHSMKFPITNYKGYVGEEIFYCSETCKIFKENNKFFYKKRNT